MGKTSARNHHGLSEKVYRSFYRDIVNGKLKPGQRITKMQIAKFHGVSQTPVREGLKRLAEDRLVNLVLRRGCYVCKLTGEDVNYLFEIRKRLKSLALEYAFGKLDRKKIQGLKDNSLEGQQLDEHGLVRKELQLDEELHSMILEAPGSKDLQILLSKLWARIQLLRICEASDLGCARLALQRHIGILDSILAHDLAKAHQMLLEHLDGSQQNSVERFV